MTSIIFTILFFSWVSPEHFPPWSAFHTEVPAFLAGAVALFASWRWSSGKSVRSPAATWFLMGLVGIAATQFVAGQLLYGGDLLVVLIYVVTFAAAWLCGYQWVVTERKTNLLETVAFFLMCVGLLTSFQILVQWLQVEGAFGGWVLNAPHARKPYANVGQPNQAATALLMATVGAAILMHRGRIQAAVMWGALLMLGLAMTITQSRTALLAATVIVVLFSFTYRQSSRGPLTRTSVLFWLLLMYAGAWGFQSLEWGAAKAGIGVGNMVATGSRYLIWSQLVAGLAESPWWGYGWLQVAMAQQVGGLVIPGSEQANYSHNIFLDLALFLGIPLAGLVFVCAAVWIWRRAPRIRTSPNAVQAIFILIPFFLHSLLEFPHAYSYFLVVVGLLLGGIDAWSEGSSLCAVEIPQRVLVSFAIAWASLLLVTGREYILAEEDFRVNRFENSRLGETPVDYRPPNLVLLTQIGETLKAMRLRAKPNMPASDLELLIRVSKRYSWAALQFRTALALGLNNRPGEATQQLRVIKGLFSNAIYLEAKENYMRLQLEQYPQLSRVEIP